MLKMGFQDLVEEHLGTRYKRLNNADEKVARPRKLWVKKMNGRLKGFRVSRSRKLNWKAFSVVIFPRRITRICAEIVSRMKMEAVYPTIIFSCQWGLPVLSHSTVKCRKSAIPIDRSLTCF